MERIFAIIATLSQEEICELRDRNNCDIRKNRHMDLKDQIRIWIKEQLANQGHGAKGRLADFLGVRPDIITRMLNTDPDKETRVIRAEELVKISEFFGSPPPGIAETLTIVDAEFARLYNSVGDEKKAELKRFLEYLSVQK
jgi:hypothetical protein